MNATVKPSPCVTVTLSYKLSQNWVPNHKCTWLKQMEHMFKDGLVVVVSFSGLQEKEKRRGADALQTPPPLFFHYVIGNSSSYLKDPD